MQRVCLSVALFAAGSVLTLRQTAEARPDAGEAVLKQLLKSYTERERNLDPLRVKYRLTEVQTPAWVETMLKASAPGGRKSVLDAEYARSGSKVRSTARQIEPAPPSAWETEKFWLYNGEIAIRKSNKADEYLITKKTRPLYAASPPTSVTREGDVVEVLRAWTEGRETIAATTESKLVGGREVTLVHLRFPKTGWSNKFQVIPERDFAVERYDVFNAKGGPVSEVVVSAFGNYSGVSYPTRATLRHFLADKRLGYTLDLEVTSVETEPRHVPDSLFQFAFPPGSQIYDEDSETYVRQAEITASHLDKVAEGLAPPPPFWKRGWFIGTVAALLLLAAAIWWRHLSRRGKP